MSTATIALPSKHFGTEHMTFVFGELVEGEREDAACNRVRVTHTAGSATLSDGYLSRATARKWWKGALEDGGKIVQSY